MAPRVSPTFFPQKMARERWKLLSPECKRVIVDYHLFNMSSRDLMDESDENFSVKFELVYTIGTQRPTELSPERWMFMERLLGIVAKVAKAMQRQLPGQSGSLIKSQDAHFAIRRQRTPAE